MIDGTTYKKDAAVIYAIEYDMPSIAIINNIYVVNGSAVVFRAECCSTEYYPHFRAYGLQDSSDETFVQYGQLPLHVPVHVRTTRVLPAKKTIIMPYCIMDL